MPPGGAPVLELLVDAHLGAGWYVFADPTTRAAMARGYKFDRDEPDVTTLDRFTIDGTAWRVGLDVAFAPADPRAVVRNPGA